MVTGAEMGCVGSDDGEDELRANSRISKRFKFSKKFFYDCTAVDYASVPRKLRSVIKKRSRESTSPYLRIPKKLNRTGDGIELQRKHGLKKFRESMGVSGGSASEVVVGPITKDEEEVAETLYALAGLCQDTAAKDKTKLEGSSETKSTALPDRENCRSAAEALLKEEAGTKTISQFNPHAPNHSSNVGGSAEGGVGIQPSCDVSQTEKSIRRKLSALLKSDVEHSTQRLLLHGDLSGTNKGPGSNILQPELSLAGGKNSERASRSAAVIGGQHELLYNVSENKSPALWPGSSSTESLDSHMQGPSMQSSTAKLPAIFLSTNCSLEPSSLGNSATTKKDAQVQVDSKKSWRRCSAHVHITHLIKVLQKSETTDTPQMQSTQSTIHEGINQGALKSSDNLTERNDGLDRRIAPTNSTVCSAAERNSSEVRNTILLHERLLQDKQQQNSINRSVCSAPERNSSEVRNAILLHQRLFQDQQKASTSAAVCSVSQRNSSEVRNTNSLHQRLLQDQEQATTSSGLYSLQKQNFDFFPPPGGRARGETSDGAAKADPGIVTMAQVQTPYLQSKNYPGVPFLVYQNFYSSTPSISNPGAAAAQKVQLPPYLGSTSYAPLIGVTSSSKQQAWQQQQQNWSDQLIAHRKPGQVSGSNLQNLQGVQDAPSLFHYGRSLLPPTHSSVQVLNSNYAPQQQQPLISGPPALPPLRMQGQHHITYGHQVNGGGCHPESLPTLQLLCNENI